MMTLWFLIVMINVIVLFGSLFVVLDLHDAWTSKWKKRSLILCSLALLVAFDATVWQAFRYGFFGMVYEQSSGSYAADYKLVHIFNERGKPPVYEVKIDGTTYKLSEDIWQKYLGEDYNTVTIQIEKVTIYQANSPSFEHSDNQEFSRYSLPWEPPPQPFTEAEVYELIELCQDNGWGEILWASDSTVSFDTSGVSKLNSFDGPIDQDEGMVQIDVDIDWWWENLIPVGGS